MNNPTPRRIIFALFPGCEMLDLAGPAQAFYEAKVLGVPKAKVKILSGTTSRLKQVAVDGDPRILGETLRKAAAARIEKTKD